MKENRKKSLRSQTSLIAASCPSSMQCFSTTLFVCSQDSSRQAFRQICLQNRLVYYDDVTSCLHTFVIDVFIVFSPFSSNTLSCSISFRQLFSIVSPIYILSILHSMAFSSSVLFVGDVGPDKQSDRFVTGYGYQSMPLYFSYRGVRTSCVPRPKPKVLTQRADGLYGWREPATSVSSRRERRRQEQASFLVSGLCQFDRLFPSYLANRS